MGDRPTTSADPYEAKRARLLKYLIDEATTNLPSRQIARLALVSEKMVRYVRAEISGGMAAARKVAGRSSAKPIAGPRLKQRAKPAPKPKTKKKGK